jgi:hypothetical protein
VDGGPNLRGLLTGAPWVESSDGEVRISRAALRQVTAVAGAGVEQGSVARDRYGRVPASENPLVAAGRFRAPVVSRLAVALRQAVVAAAGRRAIRLLAPWPGGRRWAAAFTHDLDVVAGWPLFTLLRLAELGGAGQWRRAGTALAAAVRAAGTDPVWRGAVDLMLLHASRGLRSTWFLLSGTPSWRSWARGDVTYRLDSRRARRVAGAAARSGHELGLHGSFGTGADPTRFAAERDRLTSVTARPALGVRQHFLRFRPGATHRAQAEAGFAYDASVGFPDRNGFRLGVADIVPAWDAERDVAQQVPVRPRSGPVGG